MHTSLWLRNYSLHLRKQDFRVCSLVLLSTKNIFDFQSHSLSRMQRQTLWHSNPFKWKKKSICSKVKAKDMNKRNDESKSSLKGWMLPGLYFTFSGLKLCSWRIYSNVSFWLCKEIARSLCCEQLMRFLFS